ncbi:vacuolar iron transporter Ccc1 [Beauveria bassiana ARSEF 2860]|uniref:Vacuolar iron transporter Ccc1 n=1 Tax=Beauveria bassiana (strain ARSEF 2860) TaxID=655819 RepID=J4KP72_BEAB2|nr:vacuolar iron transporter Ccc1 [Beauveria bassiana ARSEF 2860]EJP66949.1 vacuolar iron transporter Ccc1 [Beauveria bassiana ARSEF 2860]
MALSKNPALTRFLSDFTLGFSDGLTVPFALTAGLSSLGKADTVIYAGLADLCAGSISMGIGGYLSALDELPASPTNDDGNDDEELRGMLRRRSSDDDGNAAAYEKGDVTTQQELVVLRHLEPLCLSATMAANVVATLRGQSGGLDRAVAGIETHNDDVVGTVDAPLPIWPFASGLSIALGYAIGGAIPLLPYLFAATVGLGLRWSIGLCLAALLSFGAGKKWLLGGERVRWQQCAWSGLQMLALGSVAAAAAVAAVHLLGSVTETP